MNEHEDIQNNVVDEKDLEQAAGGIIPSLSANCYFEPETPPIVENRGGTIWARCKSRCHTVIPIKSTCVCHGRPECVDRMHQMAQTGPNEYRPNVPSRRNHDCSRKVLIL